MFSKQKREKGQATERQAVAATHLELGRRREQRVDGDNLCGGKPREITKKVKEAAPRAPRTL